MLKQQQDADLIKEFKTSNSKLEINSFHGARKLCRLICKNGKIVIPKALQKDVVEWYHTVLCHSDATRTKMTIKQHFTWTNLQHDVEKACKSCDICQMTKRHQKKYGKLRPKEAEAIPWVVLCVDLIGLYKITRKAKKPLELWAVTMIDPATGWFEIKEIKTKRSDVIANVVEQTWLTRYPWPTRVVLDRGTEFMAEFSTMIKDDYGIKLKPITAQNPQANTIVERVHQTVGNILRTFCLQKVEVDKDDPWSGILSATIFAIRSTVHNIPP